MNNLVWFYPAILRVPSNTKAEHLSWHRAWYRLTGKNVCLIDSTNLSKNYGDGLNLHYHVPELLSFDVTQSNLDNGRYWHNNFDALMQSITDQIFLNAQGYDELRLSYSGGTDSTLAFTALMSNSKINQWIEQNKFIIYTTPFAKVEDPTMWQRILDLNLPLRLIDYDRLNVETDNYFMVTGDGEGYGTWWQIIMDEFTDDEIFKSTFQSMIPKLEQWFISREPSGVAYKYFIDLMTHSDHGIDNLQQAWTWFENCVAIQCYSYRASAYAHGDVRITPRKNWHWFMTNKDFWDMCDYQAKEIMYTTDSTLKYTALKYIANWLGVNDIIKKNKFYSQFAIPKLIRKSKIYQDLSYSQGTDL